MLRHSIITRILSMVAAAFLLTAVAVLLLTQFRTKAIIDASQNAVYEEKLNTILKTLDRKEERLKATQMRKAYAESFEEAVLDALRQTYYHGPAQRSYPFILDEAGRVVLHPTLPRGDRTLAGTPYIIQIVDQREGALTYHGPAGEPRWSRFIQFSPWRWIVGYTVPLETKYADAKPLRDSLAVSMSVIMVLAISALSIIITRTVRPVKRLIEASEALATDGPAQAIDTQRRDEIGALGRSFVAMRKAIEEKITALTDSEAAVRKSEELFRLLTRVSPVGIFRTNAQGECQYVNEKWGELAGITQAHAMGHSWEEALHPDDRQDVVAALELCVREGTPFADEFRFLRADGQIVWLYGQAMVETDAAGERQGLVGTITDITSRKDLERQLRQAQKMEAIGTLAGGIAHDFNNLLTPIIGYAEMVELELAEGSEIWEDQQEVLKAANRATDLIKRILSFSRQSERELKPLQLRLLVEEALKLLRASIPSTIEIRDELNGSRGMVLGDPTQVQQVLMNLCTNASHAMRDSGGVLTVGLHKIVIGPHDSEESTRHLTAGPYHRLTISDTGCGMSPATLDRIFEPYFTTKPSGEGTGMGLAMAHGIVKSHGGHIAVTSKEGQGTTFSVYLPQDSEIIGASSPERATALAQGCERILVVDDEPAIAHMEEQILGRRGYRVSSEISSVKALHTFTAHPEAFDLVITDMTMPHMDGAELSQQLLAIRPNLPIIMYTGYSETCDDERAHAIGIRAYVMKPVERSKLIQVVREVLDGQR